MKKASREMGFGDDWKAALEKVKTLHVEPGKQTDLVRDSAREAEEFVETRDLGHRAAARQGSLAHGDDDARAAEGEPVLPRRRDDQRVVPDGRRWTHEDKLMSMRGNNLHFARATVHHELIPGHHLQGFMTRATTRTARAFRTPFWTEGWALYWEMLLWDMGFPRTPEDRVGMLFWRMHRAARIIFSLQLPPREHDAAAVHRLPRRQGAATSAPTPRPRCAARSTAAIRRSIRLAYMMGGLQFRALHDGAGGTGEMTNREFHDAILQGGNMPVEMVRARLTQQKLPRDYDASWKPLVRQRRGGVEG